MAYCLWFFCWHDINFFQKKAVDLRQISTLCSNTQTYKKSCTCKHCHKFHKFQTMTHKFGFQLAMHEGLCLFQLMGDTKFLILYHMNGLLISLLQNRITAGYNTFRFNWKSFAFRIYDYQKIFLFFFRGRRGRREYGSETMRGNSLDFCFVLQLQQVWKKDDKRLTYTSTI